MLLTCAATLFPFPVGIAGAPASAQSAPSREGEWTNGKVEKVKSEGAPALLRAVRPGRHPGFDRIVFEFAGSEIPGYHIEYVDRPINDCGGGRVVRVAGDGWLRVRFSPSQAHTERGRPTIKMRERRVRLNVLRELEQTCDFEAQVEWVLGVSSPNRYRVIELSNPTRLVVDIKRKG